MKKIEAVVQPFRLDEVVEALNQAGFHGMTITEVKGSGRQAGHKEVYRGVEYEVKLLPKMKVEIAAPEETVDEIVGIVVRAARTGKIGDGKIFVHDIEQAIRIRNGVCGEGALE